MTLFILNFIILFSKNKIVYKQTDNKKNNNLNAFKLFPERCKILQQKKILQGQSNLFNFLY